MEGSAWHKLLQLVPHRSRVLDAGCATGSFSLALQSYREATVIGVEPNPQAAACAAGSCSAVLAEPIEKVLAERRLHELAPFDVVVFADVLEHLADPGSVLRACSGLLRRGGFLLASVPNVTHSAVLLELARGRFPRTDEGLLDRTHLQFFDRSGLLQLFRDAGWAAKIVDAVRILPQHTEFHAATSHLPAAVREFLDSNPDGCTYQFIARAVPVEWASPEDFTTGEEPVPDHSLGRSESLESAALQAKLKEYHDALTSAHDEAASLHERLAEYHKALTSARQEGEALRDQARATEAEVTGLRSRLDRAERASAVQAGFVEGLSQPLERLRVLFVTDSTDAPYRYRCENARRQLRSDSIVADIAHLKSPALLKLVPGYSVIVLFRLGWNDVVRQVLECARRSRTAVVFDIDDLLFDPDRLHQLWFLGSMSPFEQGRYREISAGLSRTFDACDYVIASTAAIARAAEARGKPAFVHPNLLNPDTLRISKRARSVARLLRAGPLISYMSGSNTHDKDLLSVVPALERVLAKVPEARLLLCGFVGCERDLAGLQGRVLRMPFLDWRLLPWLQALARVNIAPLAELNEFGNAKSALKFFKAAAAGVPTVASPSDPMREAIRNGVNGFLAHSVDEWFEAIATCLHPDESRRLGLAARRTAVERYTFAAHRGELRDLLRRFVSPEWRAPETWRIPPDAILSDETSTRFETLRAGASKARTVAGLLWAFRSQSSVARLAAASGAPVSTPNQSMAAVSVDPKPAAMAALAAPPETGCHLELLGQTAAIGPWTPGPHVATANGRVDKARSLGNDPWLVSPELEVQAADYRYLLLQMRCPASRAGIVGQLFWEAGPNSAFQEDRSVRFELRNDGREHVYVIDLGLDSTFRPLEGWTGAGIVTRLRLDPCDLAGEFDVARMALLASPLSRDDVFRRELGFPPVRTELAFTYLSGDGIEIGALQNPLPVPPEARVRFVDRLTPSEVRNHYPELNDLRVVRPDLVAEAGQLPFADGALAFCIANHVAEHLSDPLGSACEWIRVLRPAGCLFLAVPDRTNPLDCHREVTSIDHLREDFTSRASRAACDHRHFREWAASVHYGKTEAEQGAIAEDLISRNYAIHMHTFNAESFHAFLREIETFTAGRVVRNCTAREGGHIEHIAIIRKER